MTDQQIPVAESGSKKMYLYCGLAKELYHYQIKILCNIKYMQICKFSIKY